jgi:hypothetical protein
VIGMGYHDVKMAQMRYGRQIADVGVYLMDVEVVDWVKSDTIE